MIITALKLTMEKYPGASAATQEPFVVQPTSAHTHTFILLHGLGSNGEKFGVELLESGISHTGAKITEILPGAKFIFPTSQKRRSSAYRRATINQWFDIASLDDPFKRQDVQFQGLAESSQYIRSILDRELEMIPSKNIVLGGLSQGCAMALSVLLSLEFPLGGFVGMSGWLPFCNDFDHIINPVSTEISNGGNDIFSFEDVDGGGDLDPSIIAINFARDILSMDELSPSISKNEQTCLATPVLLCHGEDDQKIKCELGEKAAHTLSSLGLQITWKGYPGLAHWYKIPDEIDDILEFLRVKAGWV
jgi:predicted esterase